ncbi:hypothetical protein Ahy_A07g033719 [Arachis hypogaea]|uniref:Uncharacterized protein n=1 Tax=Arachis hypogaea TaxID=3818 RepID=A0A445CAA5_ARAHY|nr:hypothetical protein Ahy_A07g033719 [Arachis hypogaea]
MRQISAEKLEESTNQELNQTIPVFKNPTKILCRVVNVHLLIIELEEEKKGLATKLQVGKASGARWKSMSDALSKANVKKKLHTKQILKDRLAYEEDIRAYNKGLRMSEVVAMVKEEALEWEKIISFIINLHIILGVD